MKLILAKNSVFVVVRQAPGSLQSFESIGLIAIKTNLKKVFLNTAGDRSFKLGEIASRGQRPANCGDLWVISSEPKRF